MKTDSLDKSKWELTTFGEVAIQQKENVDIETTHLDRYIAGEHMSSEDLHIRQWGTVGDGYLGPAFIRKFQRGDILYGSRRTYLKKVVVADFDGITSNTTFVIKANSKKILPELLPFIMLSDNFTEHSIKHSKGSVNPYINWKDIANYEFLLPPKEEQVRLAELFWAVDEVVERNLEVRDELKNFRKLYFETFHFGKELNHRLTDCLVTKKKKSKPPHQTKRYVGLEHIESGEFTTNNYSTSHDILADSFFFKKGDLLYSKLRPYLDKAIMTDFDGICTTELIVYDTNSLAKKKYILNLLHSKSFLNYIVTKGFGTKMPRVSHEIVSDYEFYLPEINVQEKILEKLNEILAIEQQLTRYILKTQQLKSALINQIF